MIDPHSGTWLEVERWAADQIKQCQSTLEHASDQQVILRAQGKIAAYRALLGLSDVRVAVPKQVDYVV